MLPTTLFLFFVAPLTVFAQSQCSKSTVLTCATVMATVPIGWPVATNTKKTTLSTVTNTGTTTVFTTQVVPAVPITSNTTITTTAVVTSTATPGTNTVYATSTTVVTDAQTTTTVTTSTSTTFTSTNVVQWSTSNIPAITGFIPAYGSSGDQTYSSKRRVRRGLLGERNATNQLQERGLLSDLINMLFNQKHSYVSGQVPDKKKARFNPLKWSNPVAVNCVQSIIPVCNKAVTVTNTITSTAVPSTVTSTIFATTTSTNVIVPQNLTATVNTATTTLTMTTSVLATSTASTTLTIINTNTIVSTTTSYAACASSNVLGSRIAANQALTQVMFYDTSATITTTSQVSAIDCCAACQAGSSCQFYQYTGSDGTCWVVGGNPNWCPNNQDDNLPAYFVYKDPSQTTQAITVGNGPCGTVMDAGPAQ